jgi:hypothetical protein
MLSEKFGVKISEISGAAAGTWIFNDRSGTPGDVAARRSLYHAPFFYFFVVQRICF